MGLCRSCSTSSIPRRRRGTPPTPPPSCSSPTGSSSSPSRSGGRRCPRPDSPGAAAPSSPGGSATAARTACASSVRTPTRPGCASIPIPNRPSPTGGCSASRCTAGVLLNSWLDRDLGIAGRVVAADGTSTLVDVREPLARVPQLAIHLDREVNDRGLVLDRHVQLRPVWATASSPSGATSPTGSASAPAWHRRSGTSASTTSSRPPCSAPIAR